MNGSICNTLITRITNAIIRQEGALPTSTNPGNLRDCPWFPILMKDGKPWIPPLADPKPEFIRYYPDSEDSAGEVEYVLFTPRGFWIPRTRAEGIAGIAHVVGLHVAEGDTLTGFIAGRPGYPGFAPKADGNDPVTYIRNVSLWAQIPDATRPMSNYITGSTP